MICTNESNSDDHVEVLFLAINLILIDISVLQKEKKRDDAHSAFGKVFTDRSMYVHTNIKLVVCSAVVVVATRAGRTPSGLLFSSASFFSSSAASSLRERCCTIAQPIESPKTLIVVRNRSLVRQRKKTMSWKENHLVINIQKPINSIDCFDFIRR